MTLSVVLSNYNHARFLPYALKALFAQSRAAEEIILIDDASTDDSKVIMEAHLSCHPNVRLVRNSRNIGVIPNLNRGLEMARGDKIYFAAADDITYPRLFETSIALLDQYPAAALCSSRCEIIDIDGRPGQAMIGPIPRSTSGYINPVEVARLLMRDDGWFMGPTTLWRREPLFAIGGFPEELHAFTDGYVSRLLALRYGACFSPDILAAWRRMSGGMASSFTTGMDAAEFADTVERKMAESGGIFPAGYGKRWRRRHLFGARRFALIERRRISRAEGLSKWSAAMAIEFIVTSWLFIKLRPFDLIPLLRRRFQHAVRRLA